MVSKPWSINKDLNNIEVRPKLSGMKQLHAKWTTGMYDDVTSVAGDAACFKD